MTAVTRWRALVRERLGELRAARTAAGLAPELWHADRAKRFARRAGIAGRDDPLLARLLAERAATYLDIGAGTGRHSVALARARRDVLAVEPSPGMRALLPAIPRLRAVAEAWPWADAPTVDVAFAANVLFLIEDPKPFLSGMTRHSATAAFLQLAVVNSDAATDPLWRMFHGSRLAPSPTYLDAVDVLRELGERPAVRIAVGPAASPWRTIAAAADDLAETVAVPDEPRARADLRAALASWLVRTPDGFSSPLGPQAIAIIRWAGRGRKSRVR
ncbi:MAG: class I SAM-dependent methyltransferase [Chloroflexota bacterium]|nr:class I SAM-dependent methyltransferase [Chloroflexota bacterium]